MTDDNVVLSIIVPDGYFRVCYEIEECDKGLSEVILYKDAANLCGHADAIVGSKIELCNSALFVYNLYEKKCKDGMFSIGRRVGFFEVLASQIAYDDDGDVDLYKLPSPRMYAKHATPRASLSDKHHAINASTHLEMVAARIGLRASGGKKAARQPLAAAPRTDVASISYMHRNWVNKFMGGEVVKTPHGLSEPEYEIHSNHGDNDSLYIAVMLALESANESSDPVDIDDFRHTISEMCTESQLEEFKRSYVELAHCLKVCDKERAVVNSSMRELSKALARQSLSRDERAKLINDARVVKKQIQHCKLTRQHYRRRMMDYVFMKDVRTLNDLKCMIESVESPGNPIILAYLEMILNFKAVIFSHDSYILDDMCDVVQCGERWPRSGEISPCHYILLEKRNTVYNNVSHQGVLMFETLCPAVWDRVMGRCFEENGGSFQNIPEFSRRIAERCEGPEPYMVGISFAPSVKLCVYHEAPRAIAGNWLCECMSIETASKYFELNEPDQNMWRRVLSNEWEQKFTLEGVKWYSVSHYLMSRKFPKLRNNTVSIFSLSANTPESKSLDVALARVGASIDKFGTEYCDEADEIVALKAKFCDPTNSRMKHTLMCTNDACLYKFTPGHQPRVFKNLMELRQTLRTTYYSIKMVKC